MGNHKVRLFGTVVVLAAIITGALVFTQPANDEWAPPSDDSVETSAPVEKPSVYKETQQAIEETRMLRDLYNELIALRGPTGSDRRKAFDANPKLVEQLSTLAERLGKPTAF